MAKKKARRKVTRIPASVTRFLKRINPAKMRGVVKVRMKRLKGGGVSLVPVRGEAKLRRKRATRRKR